MRNIAVLKKIWIIYDHKAREVWYTIDPNYSFVHTDENGVDEIIALADLIENLDKKFSDYKITAFNPGDSLNDFKNNRPLINNLFNDQAILFEILY